MRRRSRPARSACTHQPHRTHVVGGVAPVAPGLEIAEHELVLQPERDRCSRARDLARKEVERPPRRLVVVEDPAARMQPVAPAVARDDEMPVRLRHPVRASPARAASLCLRRLARLAEDLAGRGLVDADAVVDVPDRLQQRRHADGRELGSEHRLVPRARHERRRGEVVDLGRPGRPAGRARATPGRAGSPRRPRSGRRCRRAPGRSPGRRA